jgi:hypothetical protein
MVKEKYTMVMTGHKGKFGHYMIMPTAIGASGARNEASVSQQYGSDSATVFDEDQTGIINYKPITIDNKQYNYVPYGDDDDMPNTVRRMITENMVTSQGMAFDILACYGQGVRFVNRDEELSDTQDPEIRDFCLRNSLHECFMEQATDMKFYFFTVTEIILNRETNIKKKRIMRVHHLESCYCRFEKSIDGRIEHVFYGNFNNSIVPRNIIVIPLLDAIDPLGDLQIRLGLVPDPETGKVRKPTTDTKFAIVSRMPTPGYRYYPIPYYMSIFRDNWYDIYKLIGLGKKFMIKNTSAPRVQIEIHDDYYDRVCDIENITDPVKRAERAVQERQNIIDFITGPENAGKAIVTHYYVDPNGKENRMVRINNLTDGKKEGGDWSDDMSEASNALCFALGVHPNLIGATPGKSQMNNSGSDKRELFTLKQAMEKPFHDIMCKPYHVILHFNGWADKYTVDVPMIELTTLDKNTSAQTVNINNGGSNNGNN